MALWNEGDWIAAIAAIALFAFLIIGGFLAASKSEEVVGHPRGLFVLFYAEMWERFSYYGMRALLILYLTKFWLFSDSGSTLVYGAYTSLVYITPRLSGGSVSGAAQGCAVRWYPPRLWSSVHGL